MFGQLKQRFPILHNKIRVATQRIPSIVLACFILHNVAKFLNDPEYETDDETRSETEDGEERDFDAANLRRRGETRRSQIATTIAGL